MLAGHVWDEDGEQFDRTAGCVRVNITRTLSEEFGSTSASSGGVRVIIRMCSKRFQNRSTGCQPSRSTYSMEFRQSIRSGRVIDRGYFADVGRSKPPGSAAVGPLHCAGYRIWANRETGGGNCGHESTKSVDFSTVRTRKHYLELYSVYFHPKPSMMTTPPPPGRPHTGIHDLWKSVS